MWQRTNTGLSGFSVTWQDVSTFDRLEIQRRKAPELPMNYECLIWIIICLSECLKHIAKSSFWLCSMNHSLYVSHKPTIIQLNRFFIVGRLRHHYFNVTILYKDTSVSMFLVILDSISQQLIHCNYNCTLIIAARNAILCGRVLLIGYWPIAGII
jgi:hypothetical protein